MIKASIAARSEETSGRVALQDLRRRIYIKAKAEKSWRFWGLYVHVCKMEALREAYQLAKKNNGAPGIDGITFEAIEGSGVEEFLLHIREELLSGTYRPVRNRMREIPKGENKVRILGIPTIRDRVVQGALKLILEPIFEADFQEGSYGYRPRRTAHQAVNRVVTAAVKGKTRVIDVDLKAFFDNVHHGLLLKQLAKRVNDDDVMRMLKLILKTSGKCGVPQGGVISPLLANLYLNDVDKMLEKAKTVTQDDGYVHFEYARFADDLVILVDGHPRWDWLLNAANRRLLEELTKLRVEVNKEKTSIVDLAREGKFSFLGFDMRRHKTRNDKWGVLFRPRMKARTALLHKIKDVFRRYQSQPVDRVVKLINPILRGWLNYFRIGHSGKCFGYIKDWVEKKIRRHMMRARKRKGFGWNRWSRNWLYTTLGLYSDYKVRYYQDPKALPAR